MLRLLSKDHHFLRPTNFINGQWLPATSGKTVPVYFPAAPSSETPPLGSIPDSSGVDARHAVDAAEAAFPSWSSELPADRARLLRKFGDAMRSKVAPLAELCAVESGKTIADAEGEILFGASFFDWYAGEVERCYDLQLPSFRQGAKPYVLRRPVGVVSIIVPWNNPSAMGARALAGALAAGCTAVIKPSEFSPFSTNALACLAEEVGIPKGVLNVCHSGDAAAIGNAWMADPRVRKISFTGSVRVGKMLTAAAAQTMKRCSMELGGNAALMVFPDADVAAAVRAFLNGKFRNTGQACICINRVLVHESRKEEFVERALKEIAKFKMSNRILEPACCNFGSLINRQARDRVHGLVVDARDRGARVLCGGELADEVGPAFYPPTLLDNVPAGSRILREEIFGPACPILTFKTDDEAIAMANGVSVGLASYAFVGDDNHKLRWRLAEEMQVGMLGINPAGGVIRSATTPFGGVKESGLATRDGGPTGLAAFQEIKYVLMDGGHVHASKL